MARIKRTDITPGVLIQVKSPMVGKLVLCINPHLSLGHGSRGTLDLLQRGEVVEAVTHPRKRRGHGKLTVRVRRADDFEGEMYWTDIKRVCALLDHESTLYKLLKPRTSWERLATTCIGEDA